MAPIGPEARARERIDADLVAAGWKVQDRDEINLTAGRGIAIRELKMAKGMMLQANRLGSSSGFDP